ncbi:arylacetamide deacetylase-like [Saccostrea cucullata]|uniref:arylacetamide deacetylase-like n=1 Tax=Saccostrea cuccullata TaxID=36930 RepID=UPI002ED5B782
MDSRIGIIVVWLILGVSLALYLYTPFPDHARHPIKQRFSRAMVRLMYDISGIGSSFGLGSDVNITRHVSAVNKIFSREPNDGSLQIRDEYFDGVLVRVYTPKGLSSESSPALINIHGGGWAYLDVDDYDAFCQRVAKHANIVVVSIEYRRAPEYPFPVPLDDCVKAVKYFLKNAAKYKVDPARIGLTGDSAGGNLAMATALRLLNEDTQKLKLLSLMYPVLQAVDLNLPSYLENPDRRSTSFCMKDTLIHCMQLYAFGHEPLTSAMLENTHISEVDRVKHSNIIDVKNLPLKFQKTAKPVKRPLPSTKSDVDISVFLDPYFSPLLASNDDLKRLPKTYLMTADFDALRDDGFLLAKRMKSLGLDFEHEHMEGLEHGFVLFFYYESALEYIENYSNYLRKHL